MLGDHRDTVLDTALLWRPTCHAHIFDKSSIKDRHIGVFVDPNLQKSRGPRVPQRRFLPNIFAVRTALAVTLAGCTFFFIPCEGSWAVGPGPEIQKGRLPPSCLTEYPLERCRESGWYCVPLESRLRVFTVPFARDIASNLRYEHKCRRGDWTTECSINRALMYHRRTAPAI